MTMTLSKDGKIATVTGKYSDENGAEEFSSIKKWIPVNSVARTMPTEEIIKQNKANFTNEYNKFFKTTNSSFDETAEDVLVRVKTFYAAVESCKPGTFQYMLLDLPGYVFTHPPSKANKMMHAWSSQHFLFPESGWHQSLPI